MQPSSAFRSPCGRARRALLALLVLAIAGCVQRDRGEAGQPVDGGTPWQQVIAQAKAFTYRIGFVPTANFTYASQDVPGFPYCGRASTLVLPYSYEDPAIEWLDAETLAQCRDTPPGIDSYHGLSEAIGEVASPVTPAMIASGVPRMIYLVVHEDCHDQFTLPYGIEEPLCEVISYRAMMEIATLPGPWSAAERREIRDYALRNGGRIPLNLRYYQQVAELHARHARGDLGDAALLRERASLLARAEVSTGSPPGSLNNIVLANRMTYARHHPFMESALARLGSDLGRLVALFQQVDAQIASAASAAPHSPADASVAGADTVTTSGPRKRAAPLPRLAAARPSQGSVRPRPPEQPAPRPPSTVNRAAAAATTTGPTAGPTVGRTAGATALPREAAEAVPESPAVLLARIQAAETAALEAATRLLDAR